MKNKITRLTAAIILMSGGWVACSKNSPPAASSGNATPAVAAAPAPEGDKQVFEITVKEGYQPREVMAKAGVPVVLKMKTQGTFDCSSVFSIAKLNVRKQLPPTGETLIEIPAQKAGDTIQGVCGMGMYTLVIRFS